MTEAKYTIQKYKRIFILCGDMCVACGIPLGQYILPKVRGTGHDKALLYTGTFYRVLADGTEEELRIPVGIMCLPESLWSSGQCSHRIIMKIRSPSGPPYRMCAFTSVGELRTVYDTENTRPLGKILPVGMCSARHPARMRDRKCG